MSSDDVQLQNLDRLLKNWATNITETTKDIISNAIQGRSNNPKQGSPQDNTHIFDDIRERQSRVISVSFLILQPLGDHLTSCCRMHQTIQEAHNRQLDLLKTAISEERKEFSRAQSVRFFHVGS
jgi:hypothetical protein